MDLNTEPPTQQVLVQWNGLAPEDTSWEPWHTIKVVYNLKDKVNFPQGVLIATTVHQKAQHTLD